MLTQIYTSVGTYLLVKIRGGASIDSNQRTDYSDEGSTRESTYAASSDTDESTQEQNWGPTSGDADSCNSGLTDITWKRRLNRYISSR
jgi:hypothetical protein